jgi:hypothetical protein
MRSRVLIVLACAAASTFAATNVAAAAPAPAVWCGPGESGSDLPDAATGSQVHVIYAYPADAPDQFAQRVAPIARDLANVDSWWQEQDPTRTLRFDLASFPGCTTQFGQLDVSSVALPGVTGFYAPLDPAELLSKLRADLSTAFRNPAKKYLVYFDGPSASGRVCGISVSGPTTTGISGASSLVLLQPESASGCSAGGGPGAPGGAWPAVVAVHEILHSLQPGSTAPQLPHGCEGNHVCDDPQDVMSAGGTGSPRLFAKILDSGRDDYYGHGGASWDVRNSPFLVRLDAPQVTVDIGVASPGGSVTSDVPGVSCEGSCSVRVDAGTVVSFTAVSEPGFAFAGWDGACQDISSVCTVTLGADTKIGARFGHPGLVKLRVGGHGVVNECRGACSRLIVDGQWLTWTAIPDPKSRFLRWSGRCAGREPTCTFVAAVGDTVRAHFR